VEAPLLRRGDVPEGGEHVDTAEPFSFPALQLSLQALQFLQALQLQGQ
jgi:hypothetical protein